MIGVSIMGMAGARSRLRKLIDEGRAAAVRGVAKMGAVIKDQRKRPMSTKSAVPRGRVVGSGGGVADRVDRRVVGAAGNIRGSLAQTKERFEPPKFRGALAEGRQRPPQNLSAPGHLRSLRSKSLPHNEAMVLSKLCKAMRR